MRKKVLFELSAYDDFKNWEKIDRRIYRKIIDILKKLHNFSPDVIEESKLLRRELNGYYSLQIEEEHRLVYKITKTDIIIVACRYYYN